MELTNAIVKRPGKSMVDGISKGDLGKPDYEKAVIQHNYYIEALEKAGLEVTVLEADEDYPDSVFVEDPAIVTNDFSVITNPGADSRKGETEAIESAIKEFYFKENIHRIKSPGILDGGDVIQVNDLLYVGISDRTNKAGFEQLSKIAANYGYNTLGIEIDDLLHLKSGATYIGDDTVLITAYFLGMPEFLRYNQIILGNSEEYAANSVRINDYLIMPSGYPMAKSKLETAGFKLITLDVSEFRKLDGGLSCLSLRF